MPSLPTKDTFSLEGGLLPIFQKFGTYLEKLTLQDIDEFVISALARYGCKLRSVTLKNNAQYILPTGQPLRAVDSRLYSLENLKIDS